MASRHFVGDGTFTNWNTTNNWSTSSGGASGASVPGVSDVVYFDNGGVGNCTLDINVNVDSFTISTYTGTFNVAGYNITTVGNVDINNPAIITASGLAGSTWTVGGNYTADGVSGTLITLNPASTWTLTVSGSIIVKFVNLAYSDASGGSEGQADGTSTDSLNNSNWNFGGLTEHTGIRAYAFECTYSSASWVDDPTTLISDLQTALNGISDLNSYNRLLVSNKRNSVDKDINVEVDGITYLNKTKLSAAENDDLITDLETAFNGVTNFVYDHVNIVNDVFSEDRTSGWPERTTAHGQSFEEE